MAEDEATQAAALNWIRGLAARMTTTEGLTDRIDRLNDAICEDVPEVGADVEIRRILDESTAAAMVLYFEGMPHVAPGEIDPTPAMLGLGRILAQRGADATVVLRVYRAGQRAVWHLLMADVMAAPLADEVKAEILRFGWEHMSRSIDRAVELVVAEYALEVEGRMHGAFARRAEVVDAVLGGQRIDPDEASLSVGHNFSGHQLGLVLWCDNDSEQPNTRLEAVARAFAKAFGAPPPLTVPSGTQALWAWLRVRSDWSLEGAELPDVSSPRDVRVAIGIPAYGLEGFRSSHEQALQARDLAAGANQPVVTYFGDVELVCVLAADRMALSALVRRELGGLGAVDVGVARLRETVRVYLEAGSSVGAAERLSVHKNTVLYRLQQAEALLGHSVRERRLALEVALTSVEALGDDLLSDESTHQPASLR